MLGPFFKVAAALFTTGGEGTLMLAWIFAVSQLETPGARDSAAGAIPFRVRHALKVPSKPGFPYENWGSGRRYKRLRHPVSSPISERAACFVFQYMKSIFIF
jgi:hypothetical protein